MPFGKMPVLTINGKQYHQSLALARYCAKLVKLVGKDQLEDLEIEGMVETINDLRQRKCRKPLLENVQYQNDL